MNNEFYYQSENNLEENKLQEINKSKYINMIIKSKISKKKNKRFINVHQLKQLKQNINQMKKYN